MSRLRFWRRHDEIPVVELRRLNPMRTGIVFLVILVIAVYFGFTKRLPFKHGFRMQAVFATAVNITPSSPVRIAGVDERTSLLGDSPDDDVADPAGGPLRAYADTAALLDWLVTRLAELGWAHAESHP